MSLSCLEIDKDAVLHNFKALKSLLKQGTQVTAVVKGNAYGHGQSELTEILDPEVDCFQVDDVEELRVLRRSSQKRCLVLGYVAKDDIEEAVALGCELALYDDERLDLIAGAARKLKTRVNVHLKIDAYLGRQGLLVDQIETFCKELKERPEIKLVAAYSHFANIEDAPDLTHARKQLHAYNMGLQILALHGHLEVKTHISSTSGVMAYECKEGLNALVRFGIGLYGMYPSAAIEAEYRHLDLKPVARWVSHLAQVKTLPSGFPIGYGLTFTTKHRTKIGIVPQGYSDGYDRGLSNVGEVLVCGKRCRVLGRVAMNMFAVDLSLVPEAVQESEVVLLGSQEQERISAEELAEKLETINYEVTTRISPLLPRVVI